jgi:hypothetical protein
MQGGNAAAVLLPAVTSVTSGTVYAIWSERVLKCALLCREREMARAMMQQERTTTRATHHHGPPDDLDLGV